MPRPTMPANGDNPYGDVLKAAIYDISDRIDFGSGTIIFSTNDTTNRTTVIQAAIDSLASTVTGMKLQNSSGVFQGGTAANGGGRVVLGPGVHWVTNLVLGHRVVLELVSGARLIQIAGSTGALVSNRRDGFVHAQYCGVVGPGILDGNKANQTVANPVLLWQGDESNNYTSPLDEDYDINCFANGGLYVVNGKGDGIRMTGAGANRISDVKIRSCDGNGLYSFQDNHIDNVDIGWSGLAGVRVDGESCTLSNIKSWYSGQVTGSSGHGFYLTADSGAISACNAQDNKAAGFCWDGAFGWDASGLLSDSNSRGSAGVYPAFDFYSSNFNKVSGVARNRYNASYNSTTTVAEQASAVRIRNSSITNRIDLIAAIGVWGQSSTFVQSGSTITNNSVIVNGVTQ